MRRCALGVLLGGVVLVAGAGCGGGDGGGGGVPDAPGLPPDGRGPPGQTTLLLSLHPHSPRPLPEALRFETFTFSPVTVGTLSIANGFVLYSVDGVDLPFVTRVHATSVTRPDQTFDLVLAVGGAIFTGDVNGDAGLPDNWDTADGVPGPAPWVFVSESPAATLPVNAARAADVLIDEGTTIFGRDLALTDARFLARGTLAPVGTGRPRVTITDGAALGTVPQLETAGAVRLAGDVTTERFVVHPGFLVVDGDRTLDSGVGESFVDAGGELQVGPGRVRNGRIIDVAGVLSTTAATSVIDTVRLSVTGSLRLERGTLRASILDLSAAQTVVFGDTQSTLIDGGSAGAVLVRPTHRFAAVELLGAVTITGAPLHARGAVRIAALVDGDVTSDATVTIADVSRVGRLTAHTLQLDRFLTIGERLTVATTATVGADAVLSLDAGSVTTLRDLTVAGSLVIRGNTTVTGTLDFAPGASFDHEGGILTIAACRAGGVPNAPPCP